jgi:putative hydroxymethylpyrimidine transport system permease protein
MNHDGRTGRSAVESWLVPLGLIAVVVAGWEITVRLRDTPRWFLPPPSSIVSALVDSRITLLHHTWVTLEEVLVGFALSFVMGVIFAVAIASSRVVERAFYPFVIASQAIPIIALAPILLIWFGYGLTPKVIVVALICFFPIVVNTVDGLRSVDPELIDLLRSLGADSWQVYRVVMLPSSLPYLFSGTRIAAAVSVIGALIGEWVGSSAGLGYFMIRSAGQFATAKVFAAVLVSAMLGLALFGTVSLLERLCLPWQQERSTKS